MRRVLATVALTALLCAGLWMWLRSGAGGIGQQTPPVGQAAIDGAESSAGEREPLRLAAAELGQRVQAGSDGSPVEAHHAVAPTSDAATPLSQPVRTLIVEGRAVATNAMSGAATIEVSLLRSAVLQPEDLVVATAPLGAAFEIDASNLVADFQAPSGQLQVRAVAPGCVPTALRFTRADAEVRRAGEGEELWLRADLRLESGCLVSGRILRADGDPFGGASVFLARKEPDATTPKVLTSTTTGEDGTFGLAATSAGSCWLSVFADEEPGYGQQLVVPEGGQLDVGDIRLPAGLPISGRVDAAAADCPVAGLRITVRPFDAGQAFVFGRSTLQWVDGRPFSAARSVRTDDSGRFVVLGLAPRAYALWCTGPEPGCMLSAIRGQTLSVVAPAADVRLAFDAPMIVFDVTDGVRPLDRVRVTLRNGDQGGGCYADDDGRVYWLVPEGTPCSVLVEREGYVSVAYELVAPGRGEMLREHIELVRETERVRGQLVVTLRSETGEAPSHAGFLFSRADDATATPVKTIDAVSRDGVFSCEVEPGAYEVRIRYRNSQDVLGFFCDAVFPVELSAGSVVRRDVTLSLGGRLRLRVVGPRAALLSAECEIVDSAGAVVPVVFCTLDQTTNTWYERPRRPHEGVVDPATWADARPVLAAGNYELRATLDGFRATTTPFELRRGEATSLVVTLVPN